MTTICILGLRRSGTTIFWESFRRDRRLLCFDEPFNPKLVELPEENNKGTRREFIQLFFKMKEDFLYIYRPIRPGEELSKELDTDQQDYLRWLTASGHQTILGIVRCNFKLEALKQALPDAIIVHLYRSPVAWASSHLLPSGKGTWKKGFANIYRRASFSTRKGFYNSWHYEEIINGLLSVDARSVFLEHGIDPMKVKEMPAVGRLIYFWYLSFLTVEEEGKGLFGKRFISVPFESFCLEPKGILRKIYSRASLEFQDTELPSISAARSGFKPQAAFWKRYIQEIGIPEELAVGVTGVGWTDSEDLSKKG